MIPWQVPFLALANRMRDGWITELTSSPTSPNSPSPNRYLAAIWNFFTKNSQEGRLLLWALPLAITLITQAHFIVPWYQNILYFLVLWVASFGGAACAAWGTTDSPPWTFKSVAQLTWQGIIFTGMPACAVAPLNLTLALSLLVSGLFIWPAYAIGALLPGRWKGTPWGSVLFASFIGAAIVIAKLLPQIQPFLQIN